MEYYYGVGRELFICKQITTRGSSPWHLDSTYVTAEDIPNSDLN
jgi:hypothetical protein